MPIKSNPKRPTARHILIKMAKCKDKERIINASREKQEVTYKGTSVRLAAGFPTETLHTSREWQDIFRVVKYKGL